MIAARRLRAINPSFLVLHYRLGIGDGPVPFRIGDRWASDYGYVTLSAAADTRGWGLRLESVSGSVAIPAHGGAVLLAG